MLQTPKHQTYDLEGRTLRFAKAVRDFIKLLSRSISNIEYGKQLIRSSASVGANYIEANESLSRKDFYMRIKIAKKEAKESIYWLQLIEPQSSSSSQTTLNSLLKEAQELINILGAILKTQNVTV